MTENCMHCSTELFSDEDLETGLCPDCFYEFEGDAGPCLCDPEIDITCFECAPSAEDFRDFAKAVLNKDGPNAHPDSMFAMKYSDKFK